MYTIYTRFYIYVQKISERGINMGYVPTYVANKIL